MSFKNTFEIITKDIQELEKIVGNFQNYSRIPKIEIDLALRKLQNLYELLLMIREHENESRHNDPKPEYKTTDNNDHDVQEKIVDSSVAMENLQKEQIEFLPVEAEPASHPEIPKPKANMQPVVNKEEPAITAPEPVSTTATKEKILAEKFPQTREFINEKIGGTASGKDLTSKMQSSPIKSISGSMGINDKFFFIRELFHGNADNFNQTLKTLDQMPNFNQAYSYLLSTFEWDMDSLPVQQMLTLIRRKFISPGNE